VDQANREVGTRFDFKGSGSHLELLGQVISLHSQSEFQLHQMYDILCNKLVKRGVDISCLDIAEPVLHVKTATQTVTVREGITAETARKIVRLLKDSKRKVQAQIQGEQVRVSGKKRDDLQAAIALLKDAALDMPLQFTNFRD
jgi:uncharacterized protein YajQ (UPF0234 family)